jgi:predicted aminopeptidase
LHQLGGTGIQGGDSLTRSGISGLALCLGLSLAACAGPGYYLQAASGHWALLRGRQDVAGIIADPTADAQLVERLETAHSIVAYAGSQLGLPANGSYSEYVATGRSAVAWNVVATPEFSLAPKRWCFVVTGCVPYRAYFRQEAARELAARLSRKGMDTAVSPVTAYSTLGWFRDPLLDTMLARSDLRLAATLIHELAHQRLYRRGAAEFNESYARFVERAGVERWLRDSGRTADAGLWREAQRADRQFRQLLQETRGSLAAVFGAAHSESRMRAAKQEAFRDLRDGYRALVRDRWQGRDYFAGWLPADVNNAHLALLNTYQGGDCAFAMLFEEAGRNFHEFHRLAAERAKLRRPRLDAWLSRSCSVVAPGTDL